MFPEFQDEWLRGGPVRRWVPQPLMDKPLYVFETGGTTGVPKSRVSHDDWRTDYSNFSETLSDQHFPRRRQLADARPERPAPAPVGGRNIWLRFAAASASASTWTPLGDQAH